MQDKKLLVLSHDYSTFVRDKTNAHAPFFKEINAIYRFNVLANLASNSIFYKKKYRQFNKSFLVDSADKPSNINLFQCPIFYLPTDRGYKRLGERHFSQVDDMIKRHHIEFDMIHAHYTWSAGYVGARLKEKYGVPLVITIHEDHKWFMTEYDSNDDMYKWVWRTADVLFRFNKSDIKRLKIYNPNVIRIPGGLNTSVFYRMDMASARSRLGLPQNVKIIFNLSFFTHNKGQSYLVDAISKIVRRRQDILCIIGGEGALYQTLKRQIKKLNLVNEVRLIGHLDHRNVDINAWFNACDLFVFPSLSESLGAVAIEAMACGKPVVAYFNGGSEEVITSDDYGFIVPSSDVNGLSDKIIAALERPWDHVKIIERAHLFSWMEITHRMRGIYQSLLENKGNMNKWAYE